MARGLMECVCPEKWIGYLKPTLNSNISKTCCFLVKLTSWASVVCGIQKSVHAAYRAKALEQIVSTTALYNKLQGIELGQALLAETASELQTLIKSNKWRTAKLIAWVSAENWWLCLAATDRRLDAIRLFAAKPLPGKVIAVLDPQTKLVTDIFPCPDGHAQERSLFNEVLERVQPLEVWNADRNFCTKFLFTIAAKKSLLCNSSTWSFGWKPLSELKLLGKPKQGHFWAVRKSPRNLLQVRRVLLKLFQPTRDSEWKLQF